MVGVAKVKAWAPANKTILRFDCAINFTLGYFIRKCRRLRRSRRSQDHRDKNKCASRKKFTHKLYTLKFLLKTNRFKERFVEARILQMVFLVEPVKGKLCARPIFLGGSGFNALRDKR